MSHKILENTITRYYQFTLNGANKQPDEEAQMEGPEGSQAQESCPLGIGCATLLALGVFTNPKPSDPDI